MGDQVNYQDPPTVFAVTFSVSSIAGLAQLLRSGKELNRRAVSAAMLNSGIFGLVIAMVWWEKYAVEPAGIWFLMGISAAAGLGGITLLDFAIELIKGSGKISIKVENQDDEPEN